MIFKCPGQDGRNLKTENINCPQCGYAIEFFSDEINVKCPGCKNIICRNRLPSCVDWCKYARECVGEEKWRRVFVR